MVRACSVIWLLLLLATARAQISFVPSPAQLTDEFYSGVAVMCADMNGDLRDDIVRLRGGIELNVSYQSNSHRFIDVMDTVIAGLPQWNIAAADLNRDGTMDIVTSGTRDDIRVLSRNPTTEVYEGKLLQGQRFAAQASNLVDVNGDGWLDIFVCNDDSSNVVFVSNGEGTFVRDTSILDFSTSPASDQSGNYGSIWSDIDMDGDLDLYLSKCRAEANDPTDPRRINMLFLKTDSGYVNRAAERGLAIHHQSWCTDFGDIDNDGDFDALVLNHGAPTQVLRNDDGLFTDVTENSGLDVESNPVQGAFCDFNNDGLLDVLITGTSIDLFMNVGNGQFERVMDGFPGFEEQITSFALGDLNDDGRMDVYATHNELYNTPSRNYTDRLWLNTTGEGQYVRFSLRDSLPTIGALLKIHGPWGVQMREIRAGEGYGVNHTQLIHFGLADQHAIDSVEVRWPGNHWMSYPGIETGNSYVLDKSGCVTPRLQPPANDATLCGDAVFVLSAPEGYAQYVWSNGETTRVIEVSEIGSYVVNAIDTAGCTAIASAITIQPDEDLDSIVVGFIGPDQACLGDSIILTTNDGLAYAWSNGDTTRQITIREDGVYHVTVTQECTTVVSDARLVQIVSPDDFEVSTDTIRPGEQAILKATSDSVIWFADSIGLEEIGTGNQYVSDPLDSSTAFFAQNHIQLPGEEYRIGMIGHQGPTRYHTDLFNGALRLVAHEDVTIDSCQMETDFPGFRTIVLFDTSGFELVRERVFVDSGVHRYGLNMDLNGGGEYLLTTDTDSNQVHFSGKSPRLVRSDRGVRYPYEEDQVLSIIPTELATDDFYYYFFDLLISTPASECLSDLVRVTAVVDVKSSTVSNNLPNQPLRIVPNPSSMAISVPALNELPNAQYQIFAMTGQLQQSGIATGASIDVSSLAAGMYLMTVWQDGLVHTGKFVKIAVR